MKKLMLVGKTGSGKTSLTQRLTGDCFGYKKTQAVDFCGHVIDTPGEYIENRVYYKALIVSSYDADIIGLVQEANATESLYPPGFAEAFNKDTIGIVTKVDLCEDTTTAENYLKAAGAARIYKVSSTQQVGIDTIKALLEASAV